MAGDEDVREALRRYETVEWLYDGLNGKIIPWTKEHGGTSDDPSGQAFVLHHDGSVRARAPDATMHRAAAFASWLVEQADAYEKEHPRTRLPFVRGELGPPRTEGDPPRCAAERKARGNGYPVLLYFGREPVADPSKAQKKEIKASRKFEKSTLDSKKAAEAAEKVEGLLLLRFDLGDEQAAAYAASFGVEAAPTLVLLHGYADGPELLDRRTSGASLAFHLKKLQE